MIGLAGMVASAREFQESMAKLAEAAQRATTGLAQLKRSLVKLSATVRAPLNYDPDDGSWQSDVCAAWLHGSCRHGEVCDCTCHGGSRR